MNFSGWGEKRFLNWLLKHYPDPGTRWVEVRLNAHCAPGIFEFTMADTYLACMCELAYELTMQLSLEQLEILIQPARRREKKEMWMRIKNQSDTPSLGEP